MIHFFSAQVTHANSFHGLQRRSANAFWTESAREWLRGAPPIDPRLLLKIIFYGHSIGTRSSRRLEKVTYENVGFRVLSCDQRPDHDTIAAFRKRHRNAATMSVKRKICGIDRVAASQFMEIT